MFKEWTVLCSILCGSSINAFQVGHGQPYVTEAGAILLNYSMWKSSSSSSTWSKIKIGIQCLKKSVLSSIVCFFNRHISSWPWTTVAGDQGRRSTIKYGWKSSLPKVRCGEIYVSIIITSFKLYKNEVHLRIDFLLLTCVNDVNVESSTWYQRQWMSGNISSSDTIVTAYLGQ
jgi:hypothetical protein